MFSLRRITTTLAVGLVAVFAAPALGVQGPMGPDARDAANQVGVYAPRTVTSMPVADLRSPDAMDAARGMQVGVRDLRAPDTVDAARGIDVGSQPTPLIVTEPAASSSDFEWGDALIGAAAMLGLIGLAAGAALMVTHHGGTHHRPLMH